MANRLAQETSPYLLQHANNPVEWYPWNAEALEKARREDKPIFLSIGYAACHWCHVMEHESFEDPEIARQLNEKFVCIKVDREERPDLDHIYMQAVQQMTGHGGWPMSVFLTPDLKPFFGGTYWPPRQRHGMWGFDQVIDAVDRFWHEQRATAEERGDQLTNLLQYVPGADAEPGGIDESILQQAMARFGQVFDYNHGGFGGAPKFPHPMDMQVLLRYWKRYGQANALQMVTLTLDRMARGGIYDHLGGGFHRYSVDARWLVPHFEKMLYDNALLVDAYLDAFLVTGDPELARVARETCDYVLRDLRDPEGAFHSTEDADSEGEEGKFYVWTPEQIRSILGPEQAERFCYVYDVTAQGNFEGHSILNLPKTVEQCATIKGWDLEALREELDESRRRLMDVRSERVRPGKDDKVLVSWNALMIHSLARAANILDRAEYLQAATAAADFIYGQMRRSDGRLLHSWRHGQAKLDAYLDDYAYLINSLVTLYEASFDERWIQAADELAEITLGHFADGNSGLFYFTADDHEQLVARVKDLQDSSVPSGNAMLATALMRLGKLTGKRQYLEAARGVLQEARQLMREMPTAAGQMLIATDMYLGPMPEIVILGPPHEAATLEVLADCYRSYIPNRVIACRSEPERADGAPQLRELFTGKQRLDPPPTVFLCERFTCQAPVTGTEAAREIWRQLSGATNSGQGA